MEELLAQIENLMWVVWLKHGHNELWERCEQIQRLKASGRVGETVRDTPLLVLESYVPKCIQLGVRVREMLFYSLCDLCDKFRDHKVAFFFHLKQHVIIIILSHRHAATLFPFSFTLLVTYNIKS